MNQTVTAKIQIKPDRESKIKLEQTMSVYSDACNFVAEHVYNTHQLKQVQLQKEVYEDLRNLFNLKSQMSCNVPRTVIAKFKSNKTNTGKWIKPEFKKPFVSLSYNRDFSILKNQNVFSICTLDGRIKVPFSRKGFEKYFDNLDQNKCVFGGANLIKKKDKFYLCISVSYDVPDVEAEDINNIVGVDRGIRFLATTYDSQGKTRFYSGKEIKQKKANYVSLRKELQQKKTPSSRRRLKKIGNRENRWMNDVNHCLSKALVNSYDPNTLFVLEDLTGILGASEKIRKRDRYIHISWSYYDLETKLIYKAERKGQRVLKVDAHYTSQMCPKCGHTHKLNRDHKNHLFKCRKCGYMSNDDRIGAMNIQMRGVKYIQDYLNNIQNYLDILDKIRTDNPNNQNEQVCSDRVQSITLRANEDLNKIFVSSECNNTSSEKKMKKGRKSEKTVCTTDQLQAHHL